MKLGMIANSVQQETEGTTITTGFTALPWRFFGGTGKMIKKLQPFKNRNDSTHKKLSPCREQFATI